MTLNDDALSKAFAAADIGAVFTATLTPLAGLGNVQVHYEWLYSAMNCDGDAGAKFTWTVNKLNDTQVSLSPSSTYKGMRLYSSVRPDWGYYAQMQAPHSADWITAVGADEAITLQTMDLNTGVFTGLNGKYLTVQSELTSHVDASGHLHKGHKIQSASETVDAHSKWFLGIQSLAQPGLDLALGNDLARDDIEALLIANARPAGERDISTWLSWIGV